MAKSQIAGSVLTNAAATTGFTISTTKCLVHSTQGTVGLQIEMSTGVWAFLPEIDDDVTRPRRVQAGNVSAFDIPDTASNYRLVGVNGPATGSVYTLS